MLSRMQVSRCCCGFDFVAAFFSTDSGSYGVRRIKDNESIVWEKYQATPHVNVDVDPINKAAYASTGSGGLIKKLALSDGTEQWTKLLTISSDHIAISKNGLLAVGTEINYGNGATLVEVYDDTPTLQFSVNSDDISNQPSSSQGKVFGVAWDASNNLYFIGDNSNIDQFVARYQSDGTKDYVAAHSGLDFSFFDLSIDGHIYVREPRILSFVSNDQVRKYKQSDGSEITTGSWPRSFDASPAQQRIDSLNCDHNNLVLVGLQDGTLADLYRLNTDGTNETTNLNINGYFGGGSKSSVTTDGRWVNLMNASTPAAFFWTTSDFTAIENNFNMLEFPVATQTTTGRIVPWNA